MSNLLEIPNAHGGQDCYQYPRYLGFLGLDRHCPDDDTYICILASCSEKQRRAKFPSMSNPIQVKILFASEDHFLYETDDGRHWGTKEDIDQIIPEQRVTRSNSSSSSSSAPEKKLNVWTDWSSRKANVLMYYHVHDTKLYKLSADCPGCSGEAVEPSPRKRARPEENEEAILGAIIQAHPTHRNILSQYTGAVVSKVQNNEFVPLATFLPRDPSARKPRQINLSFHDGGAAILSEPAAKQTTWTFQSFSAAYWNWVALVRVFAPNRVDEFIEFFLRVCRDAAKYPIAAQVDYLECFRRKYPFNSPLRPITDTDSDLAIGLIAAAQRALASPQPQPARSPRRTAQSHSSTTDGPTPPPIASTQFDRIANECRSQNFCIKFQRGNCPQTTSPHSIMKHNGSSVSVSHSCVVCKSDAHGFAACNDPAKASY